jgi:GNAT superfamily N-acetyltransferase
MRICEPGTGHIHGLRDLWKLVFGDEDDFLDLFFGAAFAPERCLCALEGDAPVGALYWLPCDSYAYIYAVATHPEHRGKGLASRLLEDTHAHLKELGYAGAVLKPAAGLFPFYGRLGYETCGYITRFCAEASDSPLPLRQITAEEYGCLRKSFLPENGISQEGVTLAFLSTFASFYACADALVCANKEEQVVFEYLGNPHSAPGILSALSVKSAEIPTPGQDIPFAMWHPLNCTKMPGYLGITLE